MTGFARSAIAVVVTIAVLPGASRAWKSAQDQQPVRDVGSTPPAEATVSGVVVGAGGGATPQPVNRAYVTLTAGTTKRVAETDDEGRFVFNAVPAGSYLITGSKLGYVPSEYGALRPAGPGTRVVIDAGRPVSDLRIDLVRGAVITGTVVGLDGEPAPNLPVRARPLVGATPRPQPFEQVLTDDRGVYRVFGLAPGDYRVEVAPGITSTRGMRLMSAADVDAELADLQRLYGRGRGGLPAPARGRGASNAGPVDDIYTYATVFYPSTTAPEEAVPITLAPAEERTGVDLTLILAGTTSISGSVVDANGAPASDSRVMAMRSGSVAVAVGVRPTGASVGASDGAFRLLNVTPGRYTVQAYTLVRTTIGAPRIAEWTSEDVEVAGGGLTGLVLRLRPTLTFSGRIAFDRTRLGQPADLTTIRVSLGLSAAVPQGIGAMTPEPAAVRADGTFDVTGIAAGSFDVRVTAPNAPAPGWWLRSIVLDGRDLLDEPLTLGAGSRSLTGVVATFTDRHTSLSGTLENLAGRPAPEYVVVAFAADPRLRAASRRVASTRPATDGQFTIRDLPPGEYLLAVVTDVEPEAWRQAAFLDTIAPASVTVTIGEGEQKRQNLRVGR